MKSAYELAMERLEKDSPQAALNDDQKAEIAEIDNRFNAKLAERDVFLSGKIEAAKAVGNFEEVAQIEDELARENRTIKARREEAKEAVRGR